MYLRKSCFLILFVIILVFTPQSSYSIQGWISNDLGAVAPSVQSCNNIIYFSGAWEESGLPCSMVNRCGNIFVVTNREWEDGDFLYDINSTPNFAMGTGIGYAFIGEIILLPPSPPGEYDIVMDGNQNAVYEPLIDFVVGEGAEPGLRLVWDGAPPEWMQERVNRLKEQAIHDTATTHQAEILADYFQAINFLETVVSLFFDLISGNILGVLIDLISLSGHPITYNDHVVNVGARLLQSIADAQYLIAEGIAADPPDSLNFMYVAMPSLHVSTPPIADDTHALAVNGTANWMSALNGFRSGLLTSLERYQGARDMSDMYNTRKQAKILEEYCSLTGELVDSTHSAIERMTAIWDSIGLGSPTAPDSQKFRIVQDRLASTGYNAEELNRFDELGLSSECVESLRVYFLSLDTEHFSDKSLSQIWNEVGDTLMSMLVPIDSVIYFANEMIESLTTSVNYGQVDNDPIPHLNGPFHTTEGTAVNFSASGTTDPNGLSLEYFWDLDNDSLFDDDTGISANRAYNNPGVYIAGLRVVNSLGYEACAFTYISVDVANYGPFFTSFEPDTPFVLIDIGTRSTVDFSVTYDDPESDPVTASWTENGIGVGTGTGYSFTVSDTGVFMVFCTIADDPAGNLDNKYFWKIHVVEGLKADYEDTKILKTTITSIRPNPFNSKTEIVFELQKKAFCSLNIYDERGNFVTNLTSEIIQSGEHKIIWDCIDNTGASLPSGTYLIKLEVDNAIISEKAVLIK